MKHILFAHRKYLRIKRLLIWTQVPNPTLLRSQGHVDKNMSFCKSIGIYYCKSALLRLYLCLLETLECIKSDRNLISNLTRQISRKCTGWSIIPFTLYNDLYCNEGFQFLVHNWYQKNACFPSFCDKNIGAGKNLGGL